MDATQTHSETLLPQEGELQPDFAIRFHESMMDKVPNTDERNRLCFSAWRQHAGDEPEVYKARQIHDASEYDERRDIPEFCEHTIPERTTKSGAKLPAVKYDKRALRSMALNMNAKIADVGRCCPITNGHTSEDPKDPQPEVVGYTGAFRLGMIGNKDPKWALFGDEYHRKDRADVLKHARGRSVEILPVPDVHKREFYPIAVLSAEEPRLNLPPARYALKHDASGQEIEVERYMMVMPGGNNTAIPSDKYGDQAPEQDVPQGLLKSLIEALFSTAPMQFLIKQMEEAGQAGAVSPLVHQPPQMADMPADVAAPQPGQPQPGVPGQQPPAAPAPNPMQPAAQHPGMPPKPPMPQHNMPPGGAPGNSGGAPPQPKGPNPMSNENEKYSAITSRLELLEADNARLREELKAERAQRIGISRYSALSQLNETITMDVEKEAARTVNMSDDQFNDHVETIKTYYSRRPEAVADFSQVVGAGRQQALPGKSNGVDELSAEDVQAVVKYCQVHGISEYAVGRERYKAEKKTQSATAG